MTTPLLSQHEQNSSIHNARERRRFRTYVEARVSEVNCEKKCILYQQKNSIYKTTCGTRLNSSST